MITKRRPPRQGEGRTLLLAQTHVRRERVIGGCARRPIRVRRTSDPDRVHCHRHVLPVDGHRAPEREQEIVFSDADTLLWKRDVVVCKHIRVTEMERLELLIVEIRRERLGAMRTETNPSDQRLGPIRVEVHPAAHSDVSIRGVAFGSLADPSAAPVAYRILGLRRCAEVDVPSTVLHLREMAQRREIRIRLQPSKRVGLRGASAAGCGQDKGRRHHQEQSHRPHTSRAPPIVSPPVFDRGPPCCG